MQAEGGGEPDQLLQRGREGERTQRRMGRFLLSLLLLVLLLPLLLLFLLLLLMLLLLLLRGGGACVTTWWDYTCLSYGGGGRPREFVVDTVAA